LSGQAPERSDLVRLAAIVELLLGTVERIDAELVGEALIADVCELRDRVYAALQA
jgi:hypothetical protein